ncbi:MAG: cell division protein ZapA [candidate division KSB1 bacterium]|nr:cell division protein ZapA [candidate division KSB1 bacterium]MDZ7335988.1 cell division protein ZapA [candidate division KSB1 bacterium]
MSDEYNIIKVNIYGTEYPIRGTTDVEYIKKVAHYVDSKMREVSRNITIDSSLKVSILAALNIADELFKEREKTTSAISEAEFNERIKKLNADLDECLKNLSTES